MLSFTLPCSPFLVSGDFNLFPTLPAFVFLIAPGKWVPRKRLRCLRMVGSRGVVRQCGGSEGGGDYWGVAEEILEFMKKSERPGAFPSKKELVDGGRMDLVVTILEKGGWLSLGWDLDGKAALVDDNGVSRDTDWDLIMRRANDGDLACGEANDSQEDGIHVSGLSEAVYYDLDSVSSSGRSREVAAEDNSGIKGILKGLETQRNVIFGAGITKKGTGRLLSNDSRLGWHSRNSVDGDSFDIRKVNSSTSSIHDEAKDSGEKHNQKRSISELDCIGNSLQTETWRTWSVYRAGFLATEAETVGIPCDKARREEVIDISKDEITAMSDVGYISKELNSHSKELNCNEIQSRLHSMELELSSILVVLKSTSDGIAPLGNMSSSNNLQKLFDALEFQENEIMNAQDTLRSLRAKMAIIEGKMALSIIDAHRIVEKKQKRIDDFQRALQVIRSAYVVWPNAASQVFLAGSFNGWTTQRSMEKSSTGIFSLCLRLPPGRYEIKFIVDGIWRIDPLRPIVGSDGFKNNILLVS